MRRIRVKAIHNHLDLVVRWPTTAGGTLEVPQKADLEGSWLIEYDEADHPELENVGEENEVWFTVSPHEFTWGTITFGEPTFPVTSLKEILTRE